jgi:hypothetical protein
MPATPKACTGCDTKFYGRADARYCSTACRQKAYRERSRNNEPVTATAHQGPVPIGDDWMKNRFGATFGNQYATLADMTEHINSHYKTVATRQKHIAEAGENGPRAIRNYVNEVALIARYVSEDDDCDLGTPLGDALPEGIDPFTAAELADQLDAAIPRVRELASLLRRRAT